MSESNTGTKRGPQDLSRSFAEANAYSKRIGPRQIIARFKSVDTKLHILRNARKLQPYHETKHMSSNEDLTKRRDFCIFADNFDASAASGTRELRMESSW